MAVSTIGGSSAASSATTFEGGVQTYAFNKTLATMAIPLASISAGTYYLAIAGSGSLGIRTYDATNTLGATIVEVSSSTVRTGTTVTIPAGVSGLYLTGTYTGPIIIQTLPVANNVSISETVTTVGTNIDWSAAGWYPVIGSTNLVWYREPNTSKVYVYNNTTSVMTLSSTGFMTGTTAYNMATDGTTLVTTNGLVGTSGQIYTSSDNGATWTSRFTFPSAAYEGGTIRYVNGNFIVLNYNNNSYNGYVYSTNGTTWTTGTRPTSAGQAQIEWYPNASLWIIYEQGSLGQYFTTPTLGGAWTTRSFSYGANLRLIVSFNGRLYGCVSNGAGLEWAYSTNGINWTNDATSIRNATGPTQYIINYAIVGTTLYFAAYDQNNYTAICQISSSFVITATGSSGGQPHFWSVFPWGAGYAASLYNSGFKGLVTPVFGAAWWNQTKLNLNAPKSWGVAGYYGTYYFSTVLNNWFLYNSDPTISLSNLYYANTAGPDGITGTWTLIASLTQSSYVNFIDAASTMGVTTGANTAQYFRFTSRSSYSMITAGVNTFNGAVNGNYVQSILAYKNGILLSAATTNILGISFDEGLTWSQIGGVVSTTGSTTEVWYPFRYSGGYLAISSASKYVTRSTDGLSWSFTSGSFMGSAGYWWVYNDRLIYQNGTTWTINRTSPGIFSGSTGTIVFYSATSPIAGSVSMYKAGNSYVITPLTTTNTYYTSTDLITWTARYLNYGGTTATNRTWIFNGSDTHLVAGYVSGTENVQEVTKVVNTLTLS